MVVKIPPPVISGSPFRAHPPFSVESRYQLWSIYYCLYFY